MSSLPGQIGDDSLPNYGGGKPRGNRLVQCGALVLLTIALIYGADRARPELGIGQRLATEVDVLHSRLADGVRIMRFRAGV